MEKLYKFRCFDVNSLKTLINQSLYFAKYSELNDPSDCEWVIEDIRQEQYDEFIEKYHKDLFPLLTKAKAKKYFRERIIKTLPLVNQLVRKVKENYYGILSFSLAKDESEAEEIYTNQLMWSHYAESSKGFCLAYNKKSIFKPEQWGFKVDYDLENMKPFPVDFFGHKPYLDLNFDYFFMKSSLWAYEKEIRYILHLRDPYGNYLTWPIDQNVKFNGSALEEIILGENCAKDNKDLIFNIKKKFQGYNYKVSKMYRAVNTKKLFKDEIEY